ncbi:MAG: hypothetical protein MZV64_19350 [Ignavibacteriales bacterium]|nr:hypothetical protein [Ignavibacteriales bacterium]
MGAGAYDVKRQARLASRRYEPCHDHDGRHHVTRREATGIRRLEGHAHRSPAICRNTACHPPLLRDGFCPYPPL